LPFGDLDFMAASFLALADHTRFHVAFDISEERGPVVARGDSAIRALDTEVSSERSIVEQLEEVGAELPLWNDEARQHRCETESSSTRSGREVVECRFRESANREEGEILGIVDEVTTLVRLVAGGKLFPLQILNDHTPLLSEALGSDEPLQGGLVDEGEVEEGIRGLSSSSGCRRS